MSKGLDITALPISIIGALNWGLIGFFYAIVGLCGLYLFTFYGRRCQDME